jgi:hypothetical protein
VNAPEQPELVRRDTGAAAVADFIATLAIFAGLVAVVYSPGRIGPGAIFIALLAAVIGGRPGSRLVPFAVALTGAAWLAGMIVAVALERPIF